MPLKTDRLDREYVKIPSSSTVDGDPIDPTGFDAWLAFMSPGQRPADGDYIVAFWETDATTSPPRYKLKALPPTLAGGQSYGIWVKINTVSELVQRLVDTLTID